MIQDIVRWCVHTCRDYVPGKPVEEVERELGIKNIDKMASNENPLGTSPKALRAMTAELQKSNMYPESLCVELVDKLAALHGIKPTQLLIGNGLDNVITIIGMLLIEEGDEVIYGEVTFPAYGNITRKMGGVPVEIPMTQGMELDLDAFAAAITGKTKVIFVCNPNNPTGTINKAAQVERFLAKVPDRVMVVFDEAYFEYADAGDYKGMAYMAAQRENVMALRTFSKIYGMAGVRVGYLIANEGLVRMMMRLREPFPVNRIAQAGAVAALDDDAFVALSRKVNEEGKRQYMLAFEEMGLTYYESHANFIYVEIDACAMEVFDRMLHDGVIIRPQRILQYQDALRITIGTYEENERTIASLKKALSELKSQGNIKAGL